MMMRLFHWIIIASLAHVGLLQPDDLGYFSQSAHLVENTLQASEQEVPLEEFFWTGSGDGPAYIKPKDSLGHDVKYPNTIVRTATILATVYIDGNYDSDFDPLCVYDCDKKSEESGVVESIDHIPPSDRRYWLLTVVAGLFSPQDFPILEEKLAKLYRIAFLRQQAKHLGLTNGSNSTANQTALENLQRKKRSADANIFISPTKTFNNSSEKIRTRRFEINRNVYERQVLKMKRQRVQVKREAPQKFPPYDTNFKTDEASKNKKLKNQNFMQKVSVSIHNLVHGDEEAFDGNKIEVPMDKANQTEIIYTVIVNGKPVLASTAAQDMRLVKIDEVVKIMENDVVLKAEPYLREPEATPLIPSYMNGSNVVTTYVNQNPLLIALSTIALILLILLLITAMLYSRSKNRLAREAKSQSATQALVQKIHVDDDINTIRSDSLEGVGVDNLAFQKENAKSQKTEPPVLHFPLPPATRPSSSTSTSTTSDSSVYYPKRRYKFNSVQDLLTTKDGKFREGEIYSKVHGKSSKSDHKQRQRRKYITDNRVGAETVEQVDVHSYQSDVDNFNDESLNPYHEHNEAFNPNVSHYHANKLMSDKTFSVIESERRKGGKKKAIAPAEAINKELIQQHVRVASADSNSIGSFLSMASIRSFPKCFVPEPLSRVLEPVSVTHLDHSDADYETLKNYRMMDSQKSLNFNEMDEDTARAQSDGADTGVVGPVVWEMYKKGFDLSTNSLSSPNRDPHATRNRFEGLLEGAMKLYGSSSYSNCHSLLNQQEEDQSGQMPGVIKSKENRGKSAATIRLTSRTSGLLSRTDFNPIRPMTAGPPDTQPVQNPVPTISAWTSGSGSLVRPLSAGVYHKPNLSAADERAEINRARAMSASPIIDAIQKELKKISNEEK